MSIRRCTSQGSHRCSTSGRCRVSGRSALDELYADSGREGGKLVIDAGDDMPDRQDATKQAFLSQFPDIRLMLIADYIKYHDARKERHPRLIHPP